MRKHSSPKDLETADGVRLLRVADAGDVILGRQRSQALESARTQAPYLRVANVMDGFIDYSDVQSMSFSTAEKKIYELHVGDILLNEGQETDLVGRSAIYDGPSGMFFQNTLIRFRPSPMVCPSYAQAVFSHWRRNGNFARAAKQTTSIAHLGVGRFANMLFPLRGLGEQWQIAEILDAADAQISQTKAVIAKRLAVEFAVSSLGWEELTEWLPLAEVAAVESGLTLGAEPWGPSSVELPYLRVANVQDGYIDTTQLRTVRVLRNQVTRYAVNPGDVLLTEGGDFDKLGRGAVWDGRIQSCLHQNHIFRIRCKNELIIPEYLALYTASRLGRRYFLSVAKQTTNLASINSTQLKAMPIPVPPLRVQERILRTVRIAQAQVTVEHAVLKKLRMIKKGMMDDLLTGKVRVGEVSE
jgi:type I restriction enzyme, S subunit